MPEGAHRVNEEAHAAALGALDEEHVARVEEARETRQEVFGRGGPLAAQVAGRAS
jgi:hypothetical protein